MMKICSVFLALLMISCTNMDKTSLCLIDDSEVKVEQNNILLSSIVEVKNVIPLETKEESLLGRIEKIVKYGDYFYIKATNQPLMVFKENGKFEMAVGAIGIGPEEYVELSDYVVDDEYIYIY